MRELTIAAALREAMSQEMRRDKNVFLMGEDIGIYGGCFGVSNGMLEEFGPERIRDTPIAELGFVGAGVGAAFLGMRPILELMFSDFVGVCFDQVLNQMSKACYMYGGKTSVPLVLRMPVGAGTGAAAQHSQSLETLFTNTPGLKVVCPSNAYDAKGLMISAIRDNNPVIFLEHKVIYGTKCDVPEEEYEIPIGKAAVKREGKDVTIISYQRMAQLSLSAAEKLEKEGISCEVVDLRTLVPLDRPAIIEAAKKTGRVLIVQEAPYTGGFAGEIAATITESDAFYYLDAPIERVCGRDCPIPYAETLEAAAIPDEARIIAGVKKLMR